MSGIAAVLGQIGRGSLSVFSVYADGPREMRPFSPAPAPGARTPVGETPALPVEHDVRALLDRLPAIVYVSDAGIEGKWHYVSRGVQAMLGFSPEEWTADAGLWGRQMHAADRERVFQRESDALQPAVPDEYRMLHRDGTTIWVRDEAALVIDADGRGRWHGVLSDITDRKLAEAELEQRAQQQAAVASLGRRALAGVGVPELMQAALKQATAILGVERGAVFEQEAEGEALIPRVVVGMPWSELPDRSSPAAESRDPLEADRGGLPREAPDGLTGEIEGGGRRWGVLWVQAATRRSYGPADADFVQALANVVADALQHRATEDGIRYQALHDPLTSLPNRVLFLDCLRQALARPGARVAVLLLDLDNFKLVNDTAGHAAGDELLIEIAQRLANAIRPGDRIARLGGDEFVVMLEQVPDETTAVRVAKRIVAVFEAPFDPGIGEHFASASIGIAIADPEKSLPASLIRDADLAMYQAKGRGPGHIEVFNTVMRARTVTRLSLENDLRRAIDRDELRVAYQPIVSLGDGAIVAVEALLRWEHPKRGLLEPAKFIPIAEQSGLIEPIGRWVLDTACAQAAHWRAERPDSRPLRLSVNLSVRQLARRDLVETVAHTLASTGLEPTSLCLEITESVLLQEAEAASETIRRVAELGVTFALDDFGTGYSSLAYLSDLPIDCLKMDRSFVQALVSDTRSMAIATAIVQMARALSIVVVGEGVETAAQAEALRGLHCGFAQGFHFHRPVPAEVVGELLGSRRSPRAVSPNGARGQSPDYGGRWS
jgi:diguanylate cyclase (GGDEF)-like protein/PAS domain S-box-containing protein